MSRGAPTLASRRLRDRRLQRRRAPRRRRRLGARRRASTTSSSSTTPATATLARSLGERAGHVRHRRAGSATSASARARTAASPHSRRGAGARREPRRRAARRRARRARRRARRAPVLGDRRADDPQRGRARPTRRCAGSPRSLDAVGHATLGRVWPTNPFTRRYREAGCRARRHRGLGVGLVLRRAARAVRAARRLRRALLHVRRGHGPVLARARGWASTVGTAPDGGGDPRRGRLAARAPVPDAGRAPPQRAALRGRARPGDRRGCCCRSPRWSSGSGSLAVLVIDARRRRARG